MLCTSIDNTSCVNGTIEQAQGLSVLANATVVSRPIVHVSEVKSLGGGEDSIPTTEFIAVKQQRYCCVQRGEERASNKGGCTAEPSSSRSSTRTEHVPCA